MPGMNSGLNVDDPTVVAAFRAALLHQGLIILAIFAVLSIAWVAVRRPPAVGAAGATVRAALPEPAGRRVLRIGFGLLWLLDGVLQAQPGMAAGMPSQVIEPTASSSPAWVQHLVNWAGTTWSYHPIQAGAATVWIQAGIGLWLLAAPRGGASRLAGLASVGWGLVVWVFGESFGGIFAPGLTWLFGAPGAALAYCAAGALVALPERSWRTPRLGRAVLAGFGVFLAGMAVLQAWPGRGFWQGTPGDRPGTLAGMVQTMAQTSQPRVDISPGVRFRRVHRPARLRRQPVRRGRARGHRRGLHPRTARGDAPRAGRLRSRYAWRTGCWSRTWASSAGWAPTRTA